LGVGLYDHDHVHDHVHAHDSNQPVGEQGRRRSVSLDGVGTGVRVGVGTAETCTARSPFSSDWPLVGLKSTPPPSNVSLIPKNRSRPTRKMGTLAKIRHCLEMGEKVAKVDAAKMGKRLKGQIVGRVNVYYDPLDGCWHGWYLNSNFDPVFVNNLHLQTS